VLRPRLDAQREDGDPFLHDDAFKVAFEVLGSVDPRNPDVALGHRAVVADRIGVGRGLDVSLGQIGVGAAGTALLERKPYGCFVE
jgi:hypothetical protein